MAADFPEIAEIDINPLVATAAGELKAVDALITLARPDHVATDFQPISPSAIHALFYPRSVAFIGASAQMGKWGHMLICNTISGGYQGQVYAVNPKGGLIAGKPAFKAVVEIPGEVDLAVVTVPAAGVLDLIPQLKAKGIKYVVLITSGFGETGVDGKTLEKRLIRRSTGGRDPHPGTQHHGHLQSAHQFFLHGDGGPPAGRFHGGGRPVRQHGDPVAGLCRSAGNRHPCLFRFGQ